MREWWEKCWGERKEEDREREDWERETEKNENLQDFLHSSRSESPHICFWFHFLWISSSYVMIQVAVKP